MTMWSAIYTILALLSLWLFARFIVWKIARWFKTRFDVDIKIKSIGLFSAYDIAIRVNQLQTIEIDKVALQLQIFRKDITSRLVSLYLGEVRVRAEINSHGVSTAAQSSVDNVNKVHKRSSSFTKHRDSLIKWMQTFFKYVSLNVDMLNIMLLHAFVPDSLLHVNIKEIHLASMKYANVKEDSNAALTGNLCVKSIEGKILKSPKEASEVTSCIAEISTSLEVAVVVEKLEPVIEINSVNVDFSKLQLDVHEGALVPGIFLPRIKVVNVERSLNEPEVIESIAQVEVRLLRAIRYLPANAVLCIHSFGLAFFGDETMGETTRGAHVCSSQIMFSQFKDTSNMVSVVNESPGQSGFKVPSGYVRLQVDDVTMRDYYKHEVANMGKTVFESKLTANGVLSNTFDFTSWHADYKHKESVEFWNIIFNKLQDARRQKEFLQQTAEANNDCQLRRRSRVASMPNSSGHPDILQGTEKAVTAAVATTSANSKRVSVDITRILKSVDISVVFECTVYDASIEAIMTPVNATSSAEKNPPSFIIRLDCFTGSIDQSSHSRDFNFMSKMENFWCSVSQDGSGSSNNGGVIRNYSVTRSGYHQWGHAFNVENLSLHGSASFRPITNIAGGLCEQQEIYLLIDAKVAGLQAEISRCFAQALSSLLSTILPQTDRSSMNQKQPAMQRQISSMEDTCVISHQPVVEKIPKYRYTVACLDVELSDVNGFILTSDKLYCADCFVARCDQVKVEISGGVEAKEGAGVSHNIRVVGVAFATVHHPSFSAFATYEAGKNGSRTPTAKSSPSIRHQQTKVAEYRCIEASLITPSYLSFEVLEVCYLKKYNSNCCDVEEESGSDEDGIQRQLTLTLVSEAEIEVRWTPALHALLHYEVSDFISILTPFFKKKTSPSKTTAFQQIHLNKSKQTDNITNHGDHSAFSTVVQREPIKVKMFGDGHDVKAKNVAKFIEFNVSVSTVLVNFGLSDTKSIKIYLSPLTCITIQPDYLTRIKFEELRVIMDEQTIFTFSNTTTELASSNEVCNRDRQTFSDLKTSWNRAWSFNITAMKCFFPYKYDFAATLDLGITTFKWVKGLYRKTSHPFRSQRLPPDLLIKITQFNFEMADWDFECHLRDNHDLMKDEWTESEKRRQLLDQRMAELRKKRGELLPAKKVEELYCQLADTNINIYLVRSRKMYSKPCSSALMTWSVTNFKVSVLADESMHGMKNALHTIKSIDNVSPFPFKNNQDKDPEFVTLWCRNICLHASRHQVRLRNYPQCLMDYSDWKIYGKFCGAEQNGLPTAKRTEFVHLPAPWGPASVNRNMPALKFYHDLSSETHVFNMAWGPCWDPAWSQVNLALNLLTKASVDPSRQLPWWDKSRLLFHGRLAMSMDRVNMLHLASLDPYNTTEHMLWDWKNLYMDWTPGSFLFKGDLDIHIRNASKYDDIRFLHLPHLKMEWIFQWICLDDANPHNHHEVMPCAPDKLDSSEVAEHDSYRYFRSRNIDLSIILDTRYNMKECRVDGESSVYGNEERDKPEILLYSTTLRWLSNFWYAVNAVTRPICKGSLFNNVTLPKLKLSRHYRNVKLSFDFPELKACYWSSYAQQLGIEWICGAGNIASHFRLKIVPFEGDLIRRNQGDWSVISTVCNLSDTKIYLLKRQEMDNQSVTSQSSSNKSLSVQRNFMLSLSKMSYHRDNVDNDGQTSPVKSTMKRTESSVSQSSMQDYKKKGQKKVTSPTNKSQNRQKLVVHDLRAMWTTDNRDVGYGLYEGYNKAAVLRRNLSTKIFSKLRVHTSQDENKNDESFSRKSSQTSLNSDGGSVGGFSYKAMDPSHMLQQLLSETGNRFVVGAEEPTTEQQQLKGVVACNMDDVINKNWLIKFVNCQAMLKGPKTQGYLIMTAAQADFLNRDHKVTWRDGQLTTKSSWVGSLVGTQVFATVEKNVTSSGQDVENVPWLSVSDIAPRGPSPGMLDINDLMGGGQAIGGVVGDGVSAGSFQLQRIVSRCTCQMFYVGYEALVDSEQSDYNHLLPDTPISPDKIRFSKDKLGSQNLFGDEKPINVLTILQPELEICTNTSQFTMIIDIVENLLLYVEPVMREHWERVDRMRFQLRLTSADDAAKHRGTLAAMQSRIRTQLTNMRQLERELYMADRALDNDPQDEELFDKCANLRQKLAEDKETLKVHSEELGIIIRCFKEIFLEQKTRTSLRPLNETESPQEDEAAVVRTTEVSLRRVKWHLTDEDGQLNIAQFEMQDFLYEKINRSDESVSHGFEIGWLCLQNLLPHSIYRDVLKPRHQVGLRSYGVTGAGGRSLTLRVLCKVRPPVGGISVKDHVEVNAVPLSIQLTYHFFKKMMKFFFPDKGVGPANDEDGSLTDAKDSRGATLLGLPSNSSVDRHGSIRSLPARPPPPSPSSSTPHLATPSTSRKNRSSTKRDRYVFDAVDYVDEMKKRAEKNNSFLYIKVTQVPLCVSYKGEKEKNIEDVHEFNVTIPMLEYHSVTWTWHDFALAVKRDCKRQLLSQLIKEKLHLKSHSHSFTGGANDQNDLAAASESSKAKLLMGSTLHRAESQKKSMFRKKK